MFSLQGHHQNIKKTKNVSSSDTLSQDVDVVYIDSTKGEIDYIMPDANRFKSHRLTLHIHKNPTAVYIKSETPNQIGTFSDATGKFILSSILEIVATSGTLELVSNGEYWFPTQAIGFNTRALNNSLDIDYIAEQLCFLQLIPTFEQNLNY